MKIIHQYIKVVQVWNLVIKVIKVNNFFHKYQITKIKRLKNKNMNKEFNYKIIQYKLC